MCRRVQRYSTCGVRRDKRQEKKKAGKDELLSTTQMHTALFSLWWTREALVCAIRHQSLWLILVLESNVASFGSKAKSRRALQAVCRTNPVQNRPNDPFWSRGACILTRCRAVPTGYTPAWGYAGAGRFIRFDAVSMNERKRWAMVAGWPFFYPRKHFMRGGTKKEAKAHLAWFSGGAQTGSRLRQSRATKKHK